MCLASEIGQAVLTGLGVSGRWRVNGIAQRESCSPATTRSPFHNHKSSIFPSLLLLDPLSGARSTLLASMKALPHGCAETLTAHNQTHLCFWQQIPRLLDFGVCKVGEMWQIGPVRENFWSLESQIFFFQLQSFGEKCPVNSVNVLHLFIKFTVDKNNTLPELKNESKYSKIVY